MSSKVFKDYCEQVLKQQPDLPWIGNGILLPPHPDGYLEAELVAYVGQDAQNVKTHKQDQTVAGAIQQHQTWCQDFKKLSTG